MDIERLEHESFDIYNYPLNINVINYHIDSKNYFLVAKCGDKNVGHVLAFRNKKGYVRIFSICTSKNARNKGVAKNLIKEIIDRSKDDGYKKIFLEVRVDNTPAIKLYNKFGFTKIKTLPCFYSDGCDGIKMKLELL